MSKRLTFLFFLFVSLRVLAWDTECSITVNNLANVPVVVNGLYCDFVSQANPDYITTVEVMAGGTSYPVPANGSLTIAFSGGPWPVNTDLSGSGNVHVQFVDNVTHNSAFAYGPVAAQQNGQQRVWISGSANVGTYVAPAYTNLTIQLVNDVTSGQIRSFIWYVNGMIDKVDQHMCPGQSDSDTATFPMNSDGGFTGTFTGSQNLETASSTNVTGVVSNPITDKIVSAYWQLNGQTVKTKSLLPGQSDSYSATIDLCNNNQSFTWGYTVVGDYSGDNPFQTNNVGTGSYTNGVGGAGGGYGGGTGGSFTNDIYHNYYFTNNILYPTNSYEASNGFPAGLALDSTLRAGFGTLHNDNGEIVKGLGLMDTHVQAVTAAIIAKGTNVVVVNVPASSNVWVQNFPAAANYSNLLNGINNDAYNLTTQMGTLTNEAGQTVQYLAVLTNDMMQIVKAVTNSTTAADTNGFLAGIYTNSLNLNQLPSYYGTFTNELGQLISYEAVMSNEVLVITKELTNLTANLTNVFQYPTNITVTASINTASNVWIQNWPTNHWPTNYATELTLQGISNLLGGTLLVSNLTVPGWDTNPGISFGVSDATNLAQVENGAQTNYTSAQAESASASGDYAGAESTLAAFIAEMTPVDIDEGSFSAPDMTYDFAGVIGPHRSGKSLLSASTVIDFNPLNNPNIAPLFGFAKTLWTWGLAFAYMLRCVRDTVKTMEMCENARGVVVTSPTTKKTYT